MLTGVVFNSGDARGLDLFEFLNTEGLTLNRHLVDAVILQQLVALGADIDHSLDDLFFDEEGVEAEI